MNKKISIIKSTFKIKGESKTLMMIKKLKYYIKKENLLNKTSI